MLTAEARVETEHASRHIVRVCRHLGHMVERWRHEAHGHGAGHRPHGRGGAHHGSGGHDDGPRSLDWSDTYAVIDVGWGRCVLQARAHALEVRAEAEDEDGLRQLQEMVARRLTTGTHEQLKVSWEAPLTLTTVRDHDGAATETAEGGAGRGRSLRNWVLGGVGALLVVGHHGLSLVLGLAGLGAAGALVAGGRLPGWASTTADIVVALILLKFVFMAGNALVLGRILGRRQAVQQGLDRLPPAAGRVLRWVLG